MLYTSFKDSGVVTRDQRGNFFCQKLGVRKFIKLNKSSGILNNNSTFNHNFDIFREH